MRRLRLVRLVLAIVGGVLTLLAAFAGGFLMALGNASCSGGHEVPPMPWPQAAYFPLLLTAAALALASGPVMHRLPRLGALLGVGAVALGAFAAVICVYDVGSVLRMWFLVTAPVLIAAVMGLADRPER